ncbi:DUF6221 family protein [Streptomyces lavendulocolor]|uniref:DUF6221 family protein n=1 Tax=Streptomyces lavendulocolor TaxID=67316 RepID=UPI003C2B6F87
MDLIKFLRARLDEDAEAAHTWPDDQRHWTERGSRNLDYASGSSESVSAISVGGSGPLGWERIYVKRDVAHLSLHIARHDPARVLAEVDAKRQMIDEYARNAEAAEAEQCPNEWNGGIDKLGHFVLPLLALPYADHPDYRDEWRP